MRYPIMRPLRSKPSSIRPSSGFSLIELLVVISIIALLLGILMPTMSLAIAAARKTVCMSNLRQVGIALEIAREQNGGAYPAARYMPSPIASSFVNYKGLDEVLSPFMTSADNEIYRCPGDPDIIFPVAGMSYDYNSRLIGRTPEESGLVRRLGFSLGEVPVSGDFDGPFLVILEDGSTIQNEIFHRKRNILFADGHVGDFNNDDGSDAGRASDDRE